MALGKKSENQVPQIGGTPRPGEGAPPVAQPPSEQLITSLDERLRQLQATVSALVERTSHGEPAAAVPGLDPEVAEASRTLQMAKRTADATVAEARDDAARVLDDARTEGDRIVTEARAAADREFSAQRDALAQDTAAWESRKAELIAMFEQLDEQVADHRRKLDEVHDAIRAALASSTLAADVALPTFEAPAEPVADGAEEAVATDEGAFDGAPEPPQFEPVSDVPMPPTFPPPVGVPFGDVQPSPFYPWESEQPAPGEQAPEEPSVPVQRRGLFGH